MTWRRFCTALFIAVATVALAASPEALGSDAEKVLPSASPASTADHSTFEILKNTFDTGREVTKACLSCHNQAAKQVHASTHWTWEVANGKTGHLLGKKNVINNMLISVSANGPYCARCHISNEWNGEDFDFTAEDQVDCLTCHDTTGTYALKRNHFLRAKCSACHVTFDKSLARDVVRKPVFNELAQKVGKPSIATCGSCHFESDGGDGVKHGDLDTSLLTAKRDLDVHMAKDGFDLTCITCHKTERHLTRGSYYVPKAKDTRGVDVVGGSRATCESCHGQAPHPETANQKLNDHVDRIACQTCHIPALARGGVPTKTYWDWSTAGQLGDDGKEFVELNDKGRAVNSTQRGIGRWAENLTPEYVWFNGKVEHLGLGDTVDPENVVLLNVLGGSPDDPESRIWPVKTMRGKQPIDAANKTLVAARLYGKTPDSFWEAFDWKESIATAMKAAGRDFSGEVGFVETELRLPVNHMVAPTKGALDCVSCHSRNGLLANVPGIFMPGRGSSHIVDLLGLIMLGGAFAGVLVHGALRIFMKLR